MATKISINGKDALERLLGGESELEIELRNSVAHEFAKKYLKGLVDNKLSANIEAQLKRLLTESGVINGNWNITLTPAIQKLIHNHVEAEIKKSLESSSASQQVNAMVNLFHAVLEQKINYVTARLEGEIADDVLTRKLEQMVDARIKERLGLV